MLCRAILTAIAISCTFIREIPVHARGQGSSRIVQIKDVICVLLLSGLQKEELDANTMEKLRRHNVNIYDMNNESLRQECLLKSLNAAKDNEYYEGNENKNDTLTIPINQQSQTVGLNAEIPITEETAIDYFGNRPDLRSLIDEIKIKGAINKEPIDSGNMKTGTVMPNIQDVMNITIVDRNIEPRVEPMKSQASLDNVLNFWSKFTRKPVPEAEYITVRTTTNNPPRMQEAMQSTTNTDTKGSQEKEYINKIIAEYLASQKVSTTTQTIKKKRQKIDAISRKIKELLAEKAKEEEIKPITALKDIDAALNLRALTELTDLTGPIRINNKGSGATKKALRMSSMDKEHTNSEVPEILENERVKNVNPRTTVDNPAPGMEALKYLEAYLRLNKESKTETVSTSHTEITTESIINLDDQVSHKWNKDVRNNAKGFNETNKVVNRVQSKATKDQATVPADIIQKIADKVKEIVLKDIRKSTTAAPTTITSTIATTAFKATSASTGMSPVSFTDVKSDNRMIQTLMELFKEYKVIKETTTAPTKITSKPQKGPLRHPNIDRLVPPLISGSNPYETKPQAPSMTEMGVNPYKQSLVQIPLSPADRALHAVPYSPQRNNYQKGEYGVVPLTIQTNSVEIPPLAIPLAKPIPLINQHIIVTTPNPFARHKEQPKPVTEQAITNKYRELKQLSMEDERNHRAENPTYADLAKKLRAAEDIKKEFRDSYKDRILKLKERIKQAHEQTRDKTRELNVAMGSDYRLSTSRLVEPSYHAGLGSNVGSGHRNPLDQQISSHNYDAFNRPLGPGNREAFNRALDPNIQDTVNRALNMNLQSINSPLGQSFHESLSRPSDLNRHENYNRPLGSSHRESLNRLDLNQFMPLNRAEGPNQRDIITREVLSRLVGSNHHDVISRLVEPRQHDVINRPVDLNQQSRSHHSDAYERIEHEQMHPRFKGARFHEELERIESLPPNNYNNNKQENCCDGVAARQQMPLTKIKQRGRYDDSHFSNFLKSQQKVTDMLERILASKNKHKRPSVEIS